MNIIVPLHTAEQKNKSKESQTPQRDLLATRDIFGMGGLRLREGKENSDYILTLLMDALATPDFGKAYFGELREDPAIQEKFGKIRSGKKTYDEYQRTKEVDEIIMHLFKTNEADFQKSVLSGIGPLQHRLESFKDNKKKEQQPLKEKIKEATKAQTDNIGKFRKILKGLDERANKETCENYRQKIMLRENEITEITNKIKREDDGDPSTLAQRIETTKKEMQQISDIATGKDTFSERYQELKKQYLISKSFQQQAEKQTAHTMYTKDEAVMQKGLLEWVQKQQATYKLTAKYPEKTKSPGYHNAVSGSKSMLLTVVDFKEHFISIITELLQIQLVEEKIKKLYPQYGIRIFKAPLIDDLKANTDCFIEVTGKNLKEDLYFAVDLKTSINGEYLSKELKSEERADSLAKECNKKTCMYEIDQDILHSMVLNYVDKAIAGEIDTRNLGLGEQLESIIQDGKKGGDKNRRIIPKENISSMIDSMELGAFQEMIALFLKQLIEGKKEKFNLKLLGPTLQKALEENIKNFGRSSPLHGTAHLLDIPPTKIKNFIMEISPSITYTMLYKLLQEASIGTPSLSKNTIQPDEYEKIHRVVTREQKTTIQKITYDEHTEILKKELEKLFRKAA